MILITKDDLPSDISADHFYIIDNELHFSKIEGGRELNNESICDGRDLIRLREGEIPFLSLEEMNGKFYMSNQFPLKLVRIKFSKFECEYSSLSFYKKHCEIYETPREILPEAIFLVPVMYNTKAILKDMETNPYPIFVSRLCNAREIYEFVLKKYALEVKPIEKNYINLLRVGDETILI